MVDDMRNKCWECRGDSRPANQFGGDDSSLQVEVGQNVPAPRSWSKQALEERQRWAFNRWPNAQAIEGGNALDSPDSLRGNIESQIGWSVIPVGLVGPLRVKGTSINEDCYVPLATTEGALVASFSRGAGAITESGGALSLCVREGVQRAPSFRFRNAMESVAMMQLVNAGADRWKAIVWQQSKNAELVEIRVHLEGNLVTLVFDYTTGDAAGQNMVTFCTEAVVSEMLRSLEIKPCDWYIEGNLSGDKKASSISLSGARGKKIVSEVELTAQALRKLSVTSGQMMRYWEICVVNGVLSGSVGANGHYANGLAAFMLCTGQDVACVAEAAIGCTRMEKRGESLYVAVSLPNLIVGTVGGGTSLATAQACLSIVGCQGTGKARRLAEIAGALVLAGEISIAAAMCSKDFTRAHKILGRKKGKRPLSG